jgi:hypothetical protein
VPSIAFHKPKISARWEGRNKVMQRGRSYHDALLLINAEQPKEDP